MVIFPFMELTSAWGNNDKILVNVFSADKIRPCTVERPIELTPEELGNNDPPLQQIAATEIKHGDETTDVLETYAEIKKRMLESYAATVSMKK